AFSKQSATDLRKKNSSSHGTRIYTGFMFNIGWQVTLKSHRSARSKESISSNLKACSYHTTDLLQPTQNLAEEPLFTTNSNAVYVIYALRIHSLPILVLILARTISNKMTCWICPLQRIVKNVCVKIQCLGIGFSPKE